jgi:hypothetical protein
MRCANCNYEISTEVSISAYCPKCKTGLTCVDRYGTCSCGDKVTLIKYANVCSGCGERHTELPAIDY